MNNLIRYVKITSFVGLWAFILLLLALPQKAYSLDIIHEPILSATDFLDSLTYNYRGFNFKLMGVSVGEHYDDNVTFAESNEKDDLITEITFGVGITYRGKTNTLGVVSNIYSQIFAKNSEFNNVAEDVVVNYGHEFTENDRLNLKNVFYHSQSPLLNGMNFLSEQFQRTGGRFDHYRNRFDVNYQKDISKQITGTLRYGNIINAFSDVDIPASYTNTVGMEGNYLLSSMTNFLLSYDFSDVQFENNKDATINSVIAGIRQNFTKKLYFDGGIGLDFINAFDGKDYTRPLYQASLKYDVDERTYTAISFVKRNDHNPYVADIFNQWRTSLDFRRQLLERLGCALSLFYGDGEYVSSGYEREFFGGKVTFTYDINKHLQGNFTYSYSELNSNIREAEYNKNSVFLGLVAAF